MNNSLMNNSLKHTNPHLQDPVVRERSLARNVESSSAIEGISVKRDAMTGRFIFTKTGSSTTASIRKTSSKSQKKAKS
jgi:hypothetical protein